MTVTVNGGDGARSGPMMAAARGIATEPTLEISQAALDATRIHLPATFDPLDELVKRVRGRAQGAIDPLQVAALLEADGVNDRAARVEYGFGDVFELAESVYQRLGGPVNKLRRMRAPVADRKRSLRDLSHGGLYLLPCALFPAVLKAVDLRALVVALVLAGGLGWVWAGATSWLAFGLLGLGDRGAAGRFLAYASFVGVGVAAVVGVVTASFTGGGPSVAVLVPGVMAYQMASTLLMFYQHESWLAALIAPGAAAGIVYLIVGPELLDWALYSVTVCVAVAFATAVARALMDARDHDRKAAGEKARAKDRDKVKDASKDESKEESKSGATGEKAAGRKATWLARADRRTATAKQTIASVRLVLAGRLGTFALVIGYATASAAFLLHAQAPYLLSHLDVVIVGAPLIAAMGLVEWRARRFGEQARMMLERVRYPREFVTRVWVLLLANVVVCWLGVGVGAAIVLGVLGWLGLLSAAGVAMAAAQIAMAGAYFLAFVLAGHNRYGWLCGAIGVCIVAHLGIAQLIASLGSAGGVAGGSPGPSAFADTSLFFGSAVLLQVLLVAALAPVVGQVRRYR